MPPVRSQKCGDCWAYSATAVVEFGKCKKSGVIGLDFRYNFLFRLQIDCLFYFLIRLGIHIHGFAVNSSFWIVLTATATFVKTVDLQMLPGDI
jgi:hypothetical protein